MVTAIGRRGSARHLPSHPQGATREKSGTGCSTSMGQHAHAEQQSQGKDFVNVKGCGESYCDRGGERLIESGAAAGVSQLSLKMIVIHFFFEEIGSWEVRFPSRSWCSSHTGGAGKMRSA